MLSGVLARLVDQQKVNVTITEFKRQIKAFGLEVRKQRKLEVFDVISDGTEILSVTFAEIYPLTSVQEFLEHELRPEYIPPLG